MKNHYFLYISMVALIAIFSCNNESQMKEVSGSGDTVEIENASATLETVNKEGMVISDIPFPFEILDKLHSSKISFDQKAMNSLDNLTKYNQYNSKALNLGIYGADLAYVVTYEQFQLIGPYVKNSKKVADDLNIPFAFNQDMMDKYSRFKDNKDSLTQIVYDSYNQVDKTLKGDERASIAALVVAGSWLEGLYLSTKTFLNTSKRDENLELFKTIGAQKKSLGIVIKLLEENKADAYVFGIIKDLKKITSLYEDVNSNVVMNEKELIVINREVEKLRHRIIEGM